MLWGLTMRLLNRLSLRAKLNIGLILMPLIIAVIVSFTLIMVTQNRCQYLGYCKDSSVNVR